MEYLSKMWNVFVFIAFLVPLVYSAGEFTILHSPQSVIFKGHDHIKQSILKEVFSASVGYTTQQDTNWPGMYLANPFNLAEAIVTVAVDGVSDIDVSKGHHFPLRTDEDESVTYAELEKRVKAHSPSGKNNLVRIDLSEGIEAIEKLPLFSNIANAIPASYLTTTHHLQASVDEDRAFLADVALLDAIIDRIGDPATSSALADFSTDVFWFKFPALHAVRDLHGANASATLEAKRVLAETVWKLSETFRRVYGDRGVLVTMVVSDASHTRVVRRGLKAVDEDETKPRNLAKNYHSDYPVMFNIMLWFGVIMVFTLMAISMFIGNMDPGRDSIIYRMTSTRMKKDN